MVDTLLNQVVMIIDNVLVKPIVDYKRVDCDLIRVIGESMVL